MSTILVNNIKSYTGTTVTVSGSNVLVTGNTTLGDGAGNDTITVRGHLTASGNISASGTIYADAFESATGGNTISFNDNTDIVGILGITGSRMAFGSGYDPGHAGVIGIHSSGSILPGANNLFDLGRGNLQWAEVFASTVITSYIKPTAFGSVSPLGVSGSIESSGSITPSADDKWDLGSSNKQWKDLYVDGTASIDNGIVDTVVTSYIKPTAFDPQFGGSPILSVSGSLTTSGSITPHVDDAFDLGSSAKQWRNLHIDGTANVDVLLLGGYGNVGTSLVGINAATGSLNTSVSNLAISASANANCCQNLNVATGSINQQLVLLNVATGSLNTSVSNLATSASNLTTSTTALNVATASLYLATSSINQQLVSLNAATSSYVLTPAATSAAAATSGQLFTLSGSQIFSSSAFYGGTNAIFLSPTYSSSLFVFMKP